MSAAEGSSHRAPWAAIGAAVVLRFGYALIKGPVGTDEALYLVLGHNLWHGKGFTLLGAPHLIFPPLFPWLLGAIERCIGSPEWASRIVFITAGSALVPVAHAIARRSLGAAAARWAAWLVAVSPTLTSYVSSWFWGSMSEPLFLLLAYGGWLAATAALESAGREGEARRALGLSAVAGVAFGGAYLTRPEGVAYAVLGVAVWLLWGAAPLARRATHAGVLLACFAASAFPYVRYLHEHTGRWALSAKSGVVLEMAFAMKGKDPFHRKDDLDVMAYEALGFSLRDDGGESPHMGFGEDGAAGQPRGDTFLAVAKREPVFATGWMIANLWDLLKTLPSRQVHPWPLLALSAVGFAVAWRGGGEAPGGAARRGAVLVALAGAPVAAFVIYGILPRFLAPAVPSLLILAAAGVGPVERFAAEHVSLARSDARAGWLGLVLAVSLAAFGAAKSGRAFVARTEPVEYRTAGEWARAHLPEDAVLMCRKPEIAFYARRPMVALVAADPAKLVDFARRRHVTHVILDRYAVWGIRPALRPLFDPGHREPGLAPVERLGEGNREVVVFAVEPGAA